ncbi:MAG TPA: A24 family peptidase [Vicinamibacterales bacterium]|nr:A24 family peptidase [Vicinamibacterales bacterium]
MAPVFVLAFGLAAAVVLDVRTRRIPNWLTAGIAAAGFGIAAGGGHVSLAQASIGMVVGLLLMLPGHIIGATGAGDVKLMAAIGAVVGPGAIVRVFLYSAVAGGVFALAVAMRRGLVQQTVFATTRLVTSPTDARQAIEASGRANRFAYGPAIAAGTLLSFMVTL